MQLCDLSSWIGGTPPLVLLDHAPGRNTFLRFGTRLFIQAKFCRFLCHGIISFPPPRNQLNFRFLIRFGNVCDDEHFWSWTLFTRLFVSTYLCTTLVIWCVINQKAVAVTYDKPQTKMIITTARKRATPPRTKFKISWTEAEKWNATG